MLLLDRLTIDISGVFDTNLCRHTVWATEARLASIPGRRQLPKTVCQIVAELVRTLVPLGKRAARRGINPPAKGKVGRGGRGCLLAG